MFNLIGTTIAAFALLAAVAYGLGQSAVALSEISQRNLLTFACKR